MVPVKRQAVSVTEVSFARKTQKKVGPRKKPFVLLGERFFLFEEGINFMELRTPPGSTDALAGDVRKKKQLCERLQKVFDQFGFEEVQTPAIEYYQTYNQAFQTLQDRQMFKLIDANQDILTLRMDMTVPIARLAATSLKNATLPLRLSYVSDVWKVRPLYSGKQIQNSDCGVELFGVEDDLEILVCALEALKASGLDNYRLELSDARLLQGAARIAFQNEEDIATLADLCDRKSMVELEAFLERFELAEGIKRYFLCLPLLDGGFEVLEEARKLAFDENSLEALDSLQKTGELLSQLGYADQIGFDLGKLPHLNYYTGILFEGYVPGASGAVLSGGRYDDLMQSFGRPVPAVGFAFKLNPLAALLPSDKARENLIIRYPDSLVLEAFSLAKQERLKQSVRLVHDDTLTEIRLERELRP